MMFAFRQKTDPPHLATNILVERKMKNEASSYEQRRTNDRELRRGCTQLRGEREKKHVSPLKSRKNDCDKSDFEVREFRD